MENKKPDYYEEIHDKAKESDRKWRQADRETSPEERIKIMYDRVTNRVKTDEEG